jgi:hypothetical protein
MPPRTVLGLLLSRRAELTSLRRWSRMDKILLVLSYIPITLSGMPRSNLYMERMSLSSSHWDPSTIRLGEQAQWYICSNLSWHTELVSWTEYSLILEGTSSYNASFWSVSVALGVMRVNDLRGKCFSNMDNRGFNCSSHTWDDGPNISHSYPI